MPTNRRHFLATASLAMAHRPLSAIAADAPLISAAGSPVAVGVEPTNEEWVAARSALSVLATCDPGATPALLPMHEES